jgi:aldehyde:ferredoxin oxidoreductase
MDDGTRMRDEIRFSVPWGPVGAILARKRLKAFLMERNAVIKRVAESEEWRRYLESGAERTVATIKEGAASRWDGNALLRGPQRIVVPRPRQG